MNSADRTPAEADEKIAELIEELAAKLQAGEPIDLEACARAHPECAERIRWLLPAVQALAGLSQPSPAGPAAPVPVTGTLGDYRILREVGRGGMGVVYEAEQISLGRRVALKVLPFAAVLDPKHLRRFQSEARAAAGLHHPHIVPVYQVGSDRGVHYYAMQFIEGRTLADLIAERRRQEGAFENGGGWAEGRGSKSAEWGSQEAGAATTLVGRMSHGNTQPLDPRSAASSPPEALSPQAALCREVARLGVQAAEALDHAHQQGVVHRDVKPANLMVDADGQLWVADFGLAQVQGDAGLTVTGDLLGTLRYMSPEQALARRGLVDQRTDVYSLGATLYELLTLRPALDADDRNQLLQQLAQEEPPPVRRLNPEIPVDLETVLTRAMAKDPAERYATARELADDLQRFLNARPVLARPPTLAQRARKWLRRHRTLAVSLGVSVALLLVGAILVLADYAAQQHRLAEERGQLAEGQSKLARQRELDRKDLGREHRQLREKHYQTLLEKAASLRHKRLPGYRAQVWKCLREAVGLQVARDGGAAIRAEVLACLGDPVGLDPVYSSTVAGQPAPKLPKVFTDKLPELPAGRRAVWALSRDGRLFAHMGRQGELFLWHKTPDGVKPLNRLPPGAIPLGGVYVLGFTPDGSILIAGCEEGVIGGRVPGLQMCLMFNAGNVHSLAVHPSGRLLAVAGRKVELWSLARGRPLATFPAPATAYRVEFSADGKFLLTVPPGRPVTAWPVNDTLEKRSLDGHEAGVPAVAFSPDGRTLASVSKDLTVRFWDAATGRLRHIGRGHKDPLEALDFSPDGKWLATGDIAGVVHLWDTASGEARVQLGGFKGGTPPNSAPGQIWRLRFSPSGRHLVAGGGRGAVAWDLRSLAGLAEAKRRPRKEEVSCHALVLQGVYDLAVHPNGEDAVVLDRQGWLYSWNLTRGASARRLGATAKLELRALDFDPQGKRLTLVTGNGTLGVLDWKRGTVRDTKLRAFQIALSPGGRWVATSSPEAEVVVYDLAAERQTLRLPSEGGDVWGLAWSPDGGRLAVGLSDGGVAIWDLEQVRARLKEFGLPAPQPPFRAARPPG
jgi:serine/threonine protein kinase/WD40 repeat protein